MKKLSLTNNPITVPIAQHSDVKIDPMNWILLTISDPQ